MKKFYTFFGVISWYACISLFGAAVGGFIGYAIGSEDGYSQGYDSNVEYAIKRHDEKRIEAEASKLGMPPVTRGAKALLSRVTGMPTSEYLEAEFSLSGADLLTYCLMVHTNFRRQELGLPVLNADGDVHQPNQSHAKALE